MVDLAWPLPQSSRWRGAALRRKALTLVAGDSATGISKTRSAVPLEESLQRQGLVGLVGESGCGKTTVGKLLVKLLEPTSGSIAFRFPGADGEETPNGRVDPSTLKGRQLRDFRRQVQLIFQDPYGSMNPRRTIYDTIAEPLSVQGMGSALDRVDRVAEILALVSCPLDQHGHLPAGSGITVGVPVSSRACSR